MASTLIASHTRGHDGPLVVLLHGYAGTAEDLAPFARSMNVNGHFVFPEAPGALAADGLPGRAWWPSDGRPRGVRVPEGQPRDLSRFEPEGLDEARARLSELLDELERVWPGRRLVIGGFSQGAMLAMDLALRTERPLAAFVQLSGCRIAERVWNPLLPTRRGLRTFISHGRTDPDLSFEAACSFKDDLLHAGWDIEFCAFDGGHETPISVLRRLKSFLGNV